MLLEPYPYSKKNEIPVDVYVYKKSKYIDLENVDLTSIKGYEEALQFIKETAS